MKRVLVEAGFGVVDVSDGEEAFLTQQWDIFPIADNPEVDLGGECPIA